MFENLRRQCHQYFWNLFWLPAAVVSSAFLVYCSLFLLFLIKILFIIRNQQFLKPILFPHWCGLFNLLLYSCTRIRFVPWHTPQKAFSYLTKLFIASRNDAISKSTSNDNNFPPQKRMEFYTTGTAFRSFFLVIWKSYRQCLSSF